MNPPTTPLEMSKKLVEAGIVLPTFFVHLHVLRKRIRDNKGNWYTREEQWKIIPTNSTGYIKENSTPAPLADELLSLLPPLITVNGRSGMLTCDKTLNGFEVYYEGGEVVPTIKLMRHTSLPDACALLLLELKERKIV
jgi:hypothetical protein